MKNKQPMITEFCNVCISLGMSRSVEWIMSFKERHPVRDASLTGYKEQPSIFKNK